MSGGLKPLKAVLNPWELEAAAFGKTSQSSRCMSGNVIDLQTRSRPSHVGPHTVDKYVPDDDDNDGDGNNGIGLEAASSP